jgi:hypothetical protein
MRQYALLGILGCAFDIARGRPVPWGLTVNRDDEFLRNAAEAQRSALSARTDDERATWLRLAEGWLALLGKYPQTDGQDDPESLH